jgi:protein ELYS
LYELIEESETDTLKKLCFYYYLLKDFKVDGEFASENAIPDSFCQLISGFYALDHLQFEVRPLDDREVTQDAIQLFAYPNVTPGYTEVILKVLLEHTEYPNVAQLACLFIESVKPPLDDAEKMSLYMDALIQTDMNAAFKYQVLSSRRY